jgi:hypothetical protein
MPTYVLTCTKCSKTVKRTPPVPIKDMNADQVLEYLVCECGAPRERSGTGPTVLMKERLDNGLMPRAVERIVNEPELTKDRETNNSHLKVN